jgi:polar amino acid transport system substrate-binding protein
MDSPYGLSGTQAAMSKRINMKLAGLCAVLLLANLTGCVSLSDGQTSAALKELAPTGELRVGVAFAPARSALFVVKDANGRPSGVTVDLGKELARQLGVPVEFVAVSNTGELTNEISSGALDVTFVPIDNERRKMMAFGPAYFVIQSTYLVRPGSDMKTLADVDRPDIRVVGIAGSATFRSAGRSLKNTTITAVPSVDDAIEMLRSGKADAFALTHDALPPLVAQLPGSRILDGAFLQTGVAIAVPKERPNALAYVSAFMEDAKKSGAVERAFDNAGLKGLPVAPPSLPQ